MRKHYVKFYCPGSLFAETSTRDIDSWDVDKAVELSSGIIQRYSAKPYGFRFITVLTADPVSDGEGGMLDIQPKQVAESAMYYLGGEIHTLEEIKARADPKEEILLSNMQSNGWDKIIINNNSWRASQPFGDDDILLEQPAWAQKKEEE